MFYIVESSKSFYEANLDLGPVIERLGFVVLHRQDLGELLQRRGIDFDEECQVHEVINYRHAADLLNIDMRLSLALPWRISVFTENGTTRIGLVRPPALAAACCGDGEAARIVADIEARLIMVVDETR
ncbi:DUF302 domain-containing protein [uncultured Dechloromonas sp.]|uniref:DUF302 domain-containing protein n=1 Tax=uncultured Dechloromonas sp. TaxID=171719 RepID=UPI0025F11C00|nr:DUF302 domain-containing protein [uncultured Dechloromonas sp.]